MAQSSSMHVLTLVQEGAGDIASIHMVPGDPHAEDH